MPQYTVAGRLTRDEMELIIEGVYRGHQPDKIPMGGWGHVLDAPDRTAARRMALKTFDEYTDGTLVYEIEFEVLPERKRLLDWLPWHKRRTTPKLDRDGETVDGWVSRGSLPIV